MPQDTAHFVYATQLMQGMAIRSAVEHFRRHRGRCMGAVYWQLNDCWPGQSWSSVDYSGRYKALHYFAKRFFSPVLLSLHPEQEETAVSISNETMVAVDGYIELLVMDAGLRILHRERHACRVPGLFARDVLRFAHLPWVGVEPRSRLLVCRLYDGAGTLLTECAQIYTAHRFFRYQNPVLQCRAEVQDGTLFVLVRGGAFASGVEIRSDRAELVLEDNDFDLTATAWRPIRVLRMDPALSAAELESSLTVRSVYDIGRPDR